MNVWWWFRRGHGNVFFFSTCHRNHFNNSILGTRVCKHIHINIEREPFGALWRKAKLGINFLFNQFPFGSLFQLMSCRHCENNNNFVFFSYEIHEFMKVLKLQWTPTWGPSPTTTTRKKKANPTSEFLNKFFIDFWISWNFMLCRLRRCRMPMWNHFSGRFYDNMRIMMIFTWETISKKLKFWLKLRATV